MEVLQNKTTDYLSEDFLGLGNTKSIIQSIKFSLKNPNHESFGFFGFSKNFDDYTFVKGNNCDLVNKHHFINHNNDFYDYFFDKRIICLFHSHLLDSPKPSDLDKEISNSFGIPSFIFSVKSKESYLYYPDSYVPRELSERIFIPIFQDCITFVKDYYRIKYNINFNEKIQNWARDRKNSNQKLEDLLNKYFLESTVSSIKEGDLIVFNPNQTSLFHVGIYLKDQYYIHHPISCLPTKELFTTESINRVYKVYRYKDL